MTAKQPNLFTRHDTFFGVCEGLGQDLGINPNILRIGFGVSLLFAPKMVLAVYFAAGLIVMATRFFLPVHKRVKSVVVENRAVEAVAQQEEAEAIDYAIAA
jgi:phage shock protein C